MSGHPEGNVSERGKGMEKVNIFRDIEGTEFPAGRRTRVIIGENGAMEAEHFCQGYVVIYPGGSIPMHDHSTEETYTIQQGEGRIVIGDEAETVGPGDAVYIRPGLTHGLFNTGETDLHLMFVYAPKMIVDHWAQEKAGILK
jgi:mannose-6-phosphate isomerase-like protein (cupin superfamily)